MEKIKVCYTPKEGIIGIDFSNETIITYFSEVKKIFFIIVTTKDEKEHPVIIIVKNNIKDNDNDIVRDYITTYRENYKSHKIINLSFTTN